MRILFVCIMLLAISACSQHTDIPPTGEPQIYCEQSQSSKPIEPVDGGIGGTGAQPGQHCDPSQLTN